MLQACITAVRQLSRAMRTYRGSSRSRRSMRLCETLSLGERRTLALVSVDGEKLLLGTTGQSISLLARFPPPCHESESFSDYDATLEESRSWR